MVGWVDVEEIEEEDRRHGFMQTSRKGVARALAQRRLRSLTVGWEWHAVGRY